MFTKTQFLYEHSQIFIWTALEVEAFLLETI